MFLHRLSIQARLAAYFQLIYSDRWTVQVNVGEWKLLPTLTYTTDKKLELAQTLVLGIILP